MTRRSRNTVILEVGAKVPTSFLFDKIVQYVIMEGEVIFVKILITLVLLFLVPIALSVAAVLLALWLRKSGTKSTTTTATPTPKGVADALKKEEERKAKYWVAIAGVPIPPFVLIGLGLIAANALIWALPLDIWEPFTRDPKAFWGINLAVWVASSLFVIRDPDEKKEVHPIAGRIAKGLLALVILGIAFAAYKAERKASASSWIGWGPQLAALGVVQTFERAVVAPPKGESDEWSEIVTIPKGFSVDSRSSGHLVRNNRGQVVNFDPNLPSCFASVAPKNPCLLGATEWVQFQSKANEKEGVRVKFFPYQPTS